MHQSSWIEYSPPTDSETPTSEDPRTDTEQQTERTHVAAAGTGERTIGTTRSMSAVSELPTTSRSGIRRRSLIRGR
ncbi:hypothetical protein C8039_19080 [Halogeometricum sp. wsp3]|nr:hypothetical protein C8039_19080 [Halogeometricum sp. wsp3]